MSSKKGEKQTRQSVDPAQQERGALDLSLPGGPLSDNPTTPGLR